MLDTAVERGLKSYGESNEAIYRAAAAALRGRHAHGLLADIGCGIGRFREFTSDLAVEYVGVDVARHKRLPPDVTFLGANLDRDPIPLPSESTDIVAAIETIEHLENPRAFCRELHRVLRPGGWLVITTPNQLSVLSLLCLTVRGRFVAFQDAYYPVHLTALLPADLVRIAVECKLRHVELEFTLAGRIPLTDHYYPTWLSRLFPQALSDNVILVARKDD